MVLTTPRCPRLRDALTLAATQLMIAASLVGTPAVGSGSVCSTAGVVVGESKISPKSGGFNGDLDPLDFFGHGIAEIGDLDGDGVTEVAVGATWDDDGGLNRGAVWVLFLNRDGTVKAHQKISSTIGGLQGPIDDQDELGRSVASLGDLDGDGVEDLAVGAGNDDDAGFDTGAVWILFLNADGTVKSEQKISPAAGGFMGQLDNFDRLGVSMSSLGDLDGDGLSELAVGAMGDDDGGTERGSLWILFLNADGTVKSHQKISDADGGFAGDLADGDVFGSSVARLGDLDGNGTIEIVVGAMFSDDGANAAGAVWIIFLNPDGTVLDRQEISATSGGFQGILDVGDTFGIDVSRLTDLDGDGVMDVGVGAINDDDGGSNRGAVWVLFLNPDGTVKAHSKISSTSGGLQGPIDDGDILGSSVKLLGDLDADGQPEVAVGASRDDDGGEEAGAVWILTLDRCQPLGIVSGPSPCAILLPPEGGLAIFEVIAEGAAPLMYQWRRDGVPLSNGGTVSGADSPMLTIAAGEADVGHYDCVVTSGDGRVTSAAAVLALRPPCHGDLNRDGVVDGADLGLLLAGWGLCEP